MTKYTHHTHCKLIFQILLLMKTLLLATSHSCNLVIYCLSNKSFRKALYEKLLRIKATSTNESMPSNYELQQSSRRNGKTSGFQSLVETINIDGPILSNRSRVQIITSQKSKQTSPFTKKALYKATRSLSLPSVMVSKPAPRMVSDVEGVYNTSSEGEMHSFLQENISDDEKISASKGLIKSKRNTI